MVCITLFEAISELQKKRLHQSHILRCLARMDEHVDNFCKQRAECLHYTFVQDMVSGRHLHTGEVSIPHRSYCNGAEISKFSEILGELSMRKQCVPGSFFSAHSQEPGYKDSMYSD